MSAVAAVRQVQDVEPAPQAFDFALAAAGRLLWLHEPGIGYLDMEDPNLYGSAYFEHFRALDLTSFARQLNEARVTLVRRYWPGPVTDIGIGGGGFLLAHGDAMGWDVNESALRWLRDHGRLSDPRTDGVDAVTMWDSIEHMRNPSEILRHVRKWAFIATPIYADAEHARRSKHFKPGEHLWYFTDRGLIAFMAMHGFQLRERSMVETALGRDGIGSYAFQRVS